MDPRRPSRLRGNLGDPSNYGILLLGELIRVDAFVTGWLIRLIVFQKGIRGAGLAYHTDIRINEESGSIVFEVIRSPNCIKAIRTAGRIVRGLVDGTVSAPLYERNTLGLFIRGRFCGRTRRLRSMSIF
jgi:hypothetical protein